MKPIQTLNQFLSPKRLSSSVTATAATFPSSTSSLAVDSDEDFDDGVTHHSPTQVLKNFNEIFLLRIEFPSSDNQSITDSFYTNGDLKLRIVWTISSLNTASARHYLVQLIISEHATLDNLLLTNADAQGVFYMNREQLEELRVKPLSASSAYSYMLFLAGICLQHYMFFFTCWIGCSMCRYCGVGLSESNFDNKQQGHESSLKLNVKVSIRPCKSCGEKLERANVKWHSTSPYATPLISSTTCITKY